MSEEALYRDSAAGNKARALLEDELLIDTFKYLKQSYTDAWIAARTPDAREANWHSIHALDRVQDHLNTVFTNGKLADHQIEQMVKRSRRAA